MTLAFAAAPVTVTQPDDVPAIGLGQACLATAGLWRTRRYLGRDRAGCIILAIGDLSSRGAKRSSSAKPNTPTVKPD